MDLLWEGLRGTGVSWLGIYLVDPAAPSESRLVLGACRDRPACSPIGLHGVCGRGVTTRQTVIVEDVRTLGSSYVACDPRDLSEIVLPLGSPEPWGVLDLDSHEMRAFGTEDARGLASLIEAARLRPEHPGAVR